MLKHGTKILEEKFLIEKLERQLECRCRDVARASSGEIVPSPFSQKTGDADSI